MAKGDDFKCEPGKVLSAEEAADYTAYRNLGISPPDSYSDVVMEAQDGKGLVHRCKTTAEKAADEKAHAAGLKASQEVTEREERVRQEARARIAADRGIAVEEVQLNPQGSSRATNEAETANLANRGEKKDDK